MNFLKKFFSFNYYLDILAEKQEFKPFLAISFLALALLLKPSFFAVKDLYPLVKNLEKKVFTLIDEVYPSELEIKIKNGLVSTNVTEPYYITIRKETLENLFSLKKDNAETSSKIRLLTIDTKSGVEDFEKYQSLALLGKTSLMYYKDSQISVFPLWKVKSLTINREIIKSEIKKLNKGNRLSKILAVFLLITPLFIFLSFFIFFTAVFLFTAIAVYIIIKISQLNLSFKKVFCYTSAIAFIPTLIQNVLPVIPGYWETFSPAERIFNFFILGLCYYGITLYKQKLQNYETNQQANQ